MLKPSLKNPSEARSWWVKETHASDHLLEASNSLVTKFPNRGKNKSHVTCTFPKGGNYYIIIFQRETNR